MPPGLRTVVDQGGITDRRHRRSFVTNDHCPIPTSSIYRGIGLPLYTLQVHQNLEVKNVCEKGTSLLVFVVVIVVVVVVLLIIIKLLKYIVLLLLHISGICCGLDSKRKKHCVCLAM